MWLEESEWGLLNVCYPVGVKVKAKGAMAALEWAPAM